MTTRRRFLTSSSLALAGAPLARLAVRRKLLIIRLLGGADGIAMVPPLGDPDYLRLRPTLAVPSALRLDPCFGLHPALAPIKPLYDAGELAVIHAAGFPQSSGSHFEAQRRLPAADAIDLHGWDTHSQQSARMPGLLAGLAATLLRLRRPDRTIVVLSEFGRSVRENPHGGTDHGHGQAVLLWNGALPGGRVHARWPGLAANHLPVTTDLTPYLQPGDPT